MLFLLPNQRCQSTERLSHSDYGQDAKVLLNGVTCTISVPEFSYTTPQPIYGPFSECTWVSRCENFWTLWCKGRLRQADTVTIRLATTLTGLTSAHLHYPLHIFYTLHVLPAVQLTASKHLHYSTKLTTEGSIMFVLNNQQY